MKTGTREGIRKVPTLWTKSIILDNQIKKDWKDRKFMKVKTWRKGQERNKAKGRWYDKENKEKDERIERKVVRQGKKETGKRSLQTFKRQHYIIK